MNSESIREDVSRYISTNFLFDPEKKVDENQPLIGSGVLDSTGVLELISFLETSYKIRFNDDELVAENFDSVGKISSFILRKLNP